MDKCKTNRPPLYQIDDQHVASCFLYEGQSVLPGEDMGQLFKSKKPRQPVDEVPSGNGVAAGVVS
jgi:hypothetical protein